MQHEDAAAKKLGLTRNEAGQLQLDRTSILSAIGGWLGIIESAAPGLAFALTFTFTQDKAVSVIIASAVAIVFLAAQIVRKRPLTQALAGAAGIAISYYLVQKSGNAADYFIPGFLTNLGYGGVLALSVLIRWPIIGLLAGLLRGEGLSWRKSKPLRRRYTAATLVWVALFSARLLVQVPLYLSNNVTALGIVKTFMGVPLYAFSIWLTWLIIRKSVTAVD